MKAEFDEELLEQLYWEFENSRNKKPEDERLNFKGKLRYFHNEMCKQQKEKK